MQPFGARAVVFLLELVERRVERTKGMTENAVIVIERRTGGVCPDVMGAFVVRDQYRAARDIRVVRMRQRNSARNQAREQQERDAGTPPDPRGTPEHRIQLTDGGGLRQALADWQIGRLADYALSLRALGCTRATNVSEPCTASPST